MCSRPSSSPKLPSSIERLSHVLRRLPGIGARGAQRSAFDLLSWSKEQKEQLLTTLQDSFSTLGSCLRCGCWIELYPDQRPLHEQCPNCEAKNDGALCDTWKKTPRSLCLIAFPRQAYTLASIRLLQTDHHSMNLSFQVLGGLIDPLRGIEVEDLELQALCRRIEEENIEEIVLALDSTIEGDATANYLSEMLQGRYPHIAPKIKRPAFGMPVNSSIDFVDSQTLAQAFSHRARAT